MTAKERMGKVREAFTSAKYRCRKPQNTFWWRMFSGIIGVLGLAGIVGIFTFLLQLRDTVLDAPKLRKEVNVLKKQQAGDKQKFQFIIYNDNNYQVPTGYLETVFRDLDEAAVKPETE